MDDGSAVRARAAARAALSSATSRRADAGSEAGRVRGQIHRQELPVGRPDSGSRYRYLVPNPWTPTDRDSEPMDWNPWFSTRTTMSLMPSCNAVTSSELSMRYDPSPTMT